MNRSSVVLTRVGVLVAAALPAGLGLFGASQARPPGPPTSRAAEVEAVAKLLKHKDVETRVAAAEALGHMGAGAVSPLVAALQDDASKVRATAAASIAKLGPEAKAALPTVASRLDGGEKDVAAQKALRDALVAISKPPARQPDPPAAPAACRGCDNKGVVNCKECKGVGEVVGKNIFNGAPAVVPCDKCNVFAVFGGNHVGILAKGMVPCYVCDGKKAAAAAPPAGPADRRKELTTRLTKLRADEEEGQAALKATRKLLATATKEYEESGGKFGDLDLPKSELSGADVRRFRALVSGIETELRDIQTDMRDVQRQLDALRE